MIAIDLVRLQVLDADPKAIQQINFIGNVAQDLDENAMFFTIEEPKKNHFRFFTRNGESIVVFFLLECKMTQHNTLNIMLSN